jgi:hypothetical protein
MGGLAFAEQQSIWKLIVTLWSLMAGCAMAGEYSALLQEQSNFLTMVISGIGTMVLIVGVESYLEMFQANNLERYQTYDQYLSRERRRSIDRTRQMFVLNGVHDALAQSLAEDATIGRAVELEANRRVKVLHGTFGSGKSLSVERTIQAVKAKGKPPRLIPVKFGPGGVTGALNDCLPTPARQLGRRKSRALLIAIEDLHGYADAAAVEILDGARRLAEEGAFVIITTRHPPRQATEEEKVQVADLTEDEAQALIARIQGERPTFQAWHGLSDALRNSLTSPFMAIAFASCTLGHTGDFPQTRAQLTASLLTLLETRVAGQTNAGEILGALRRIAVESTDDGGRPILPPADVSATAIELASRAGLLTREGSRVNISLPIIREWLAAEALVRQEVPWDATVLSLARAISWRGAVEAAIARGTANQVARLLGPLARQWIGIAAEVIHRMTSGWGPIAVADQPTTQEAAERLLEAMQALVDGLGPSSAFLAPTRDGRLLTLSIAAYGGSISYRN